MRKMKRFIAPLVITAIIIAAAVIFIPRLTHTCNNCDRFFIGPGYSANVISNAISSISGTEEKVLCKECAAREHALSIAAGKSLNDFRLPLFEKVKD